MKIKRQTENTRFVQRVGRALRRAAKAARKTAKMYGTPIYVWEDGKGWQRNRELSDCNLSLAF